MQHNAKMNIRSRGLLSCLMFRPSLGVPLGIWVALSVLYYWWLISRINVLQTQNRAYKAQAQAMNVMTQSQSAIRRMFTGPGTTEVPVIPDAAGTLCETIHITLVCMSKCTQQLMPMLKSLLHHRQNPIHYHMIVDRTSQKTITKLFDSWALPDVKYTCYESHRRLSSIQWLPNSHYSGIYALVKLLIPDILPASLKQVIVLDSDLTFTSDVVELWVMFRNMSKEQVIGLVENESDWYLDRGSARWPALGRGYNTGVMLLNLAKIRQLNWSALWHEAVIDNLAELKQTMLADQDIINAVIKRSPRIVYNMSCEYNVQLSTQTLAKNCYGEDVKNIKIIHWNSPKKYDIKIRDSDYFRSIHQSYVNFDANLLREKLHRCDQVDTVLYKMNYSDLCISFRAAQRVKLRTHLYYMDYSYNSSDNFDVTLVIQLSMDRLQFLERLVQYWDGPISAAIYLSDCEVPGLRSFIRDWSSLSGRRNIGYHLVYKHDELHYPVNHLRNIALEEAQTPYVFLMDADFAPMRGLYHHLRSALRLINPYPLKKGLVVPAFETQRYRASPPRNKAALVSRLASHATNGDVSPFRAREWARGHRPTNYTRWLTADQPYEVEWQPDYEPYIVVHKTVPKYDTRFSGFGWNKVSHFVELRALGYRAVVLPDAFVIHTPHAPSRDISAFRAHPHYRICLALLKQEFMDDLKRKYNVTFDEPQENKEKDPYHEQAKNLLLNQAKNET